MAREKATQDALKANIRQAMVDRGVKARHMAEVLDVKPQTFHNRMHAGWFTRDEIDAMAGKFDMSVDELMGDSFFREEGRAHNLERRREIQAEQFAERRARYAAQIEAKEQERIVRARSSRALCCQCGAVRMVDTTTCGRLVAGKLADTGPGPKRRWVGRVACTYCQAETDHAVLRDNSDNRDELERNMSKPTAEQKAASDRDALMTRLIGFGIDVRYRRIGTRKQSGVPIIQAEYDESKSQWRIEIQTDAPASLQLARLQDIWNVIAQDDKEWWSDRDLTPERGVWMWASTSLWEQASEHLAEEIASRIGAERELMARDMKHELPSTDKEVA